MNQHFSPSSLHAKVATFGFDRKADGNFKSHKPEDDVLFNKTDFGQTSLSYVLPSGGSPIRFLKTPNL